MTDFRSVPAGIPKRIGVAADHGGFELKEYLVGMLRETQYEVVDFGDEQQRPDDDYPDFVVPLARAVARGEVDRGVAICGSGVGACVAANKVPGVRACLIHESFSARPGGRGRRHARDLPGRSCGREYVRLGIGQNLSRSTIQRRRASPPSFGQSQRTGRHGDENMKNESSETIGNARPVHLAGLYPTRSDRQRRAPAFDRG